MLALSNELGSVPSSSIFEKNSIRIGIPLGQKEKGEERDTSAGLCVLPHPTLVHNLGAGNLQNDSGCLSQARKPAAWWLFLVTTPLIQALRSTPCMQGL